MPRAKRTCSTCPAIIPAHQSRCDTCTTRADRARGTAAERGYTSTGHQRFRRAVLTRDPVCVVCRAAWATVADHHPLSRRDLIDAGHNPDDPTRGRGLCVMCHNRSTAQAQPGGWNVSGMGGGRPL